MKLNVDPFPYQSEVWKPVKGYSKEYEVSNIGRVRAVPRPRKDSIGRSIGNTYKVRKLKVTKFGYSTITLVKDKKYKTHFVHRLVVEAFIRGIKGKEQVNHKDGNKLNNHIGNLEIVTPEENIKHAVDNGLLKGHGLKSFKKKVLNLREKEIIKNSEEPKTVLARRYGVNVKTIYNIQRR